MTTESLKRGQEILVEIESIEKQITKLSKDRGVRGVHVMFYEDHVQYGFNIEEIPEAQQFVESVIARMKDDIKNLEIEFENL